MSKPTIKIEWHLCHRKPERSFFYKGRQFPVCARCTGIYIGMMAIYLFLIPLFRLPLWVGAVMLFPALIDGTVQALTPWESKNWLRFSTGLLHGIGIAVFGRWFAEMMSSALTYMFH